MGALGVPSGMMTLLPQHSRTACCLTDSGMLSTEQELKQSLADPV